MMRKYLTFCSIQNQALFCGAFVAIGIAVQVDGFRNADAQAVACTSGCVATQARINSPTSPYIYAFTSSQAFHMKGVAPVAASIIGNGATNGMAKCNGTNRCIVVSTNDDFDREAVNTGNCAQPRPIPHKVCDENP